MSDTVKITMSKQKYDNLIEIKKDFDWEKDKVIDFYKWYAEDRIQEYKTWTDIMIWTLWIISVVEFICLITK